ncbi:MAG: UvrABC system protein A [Candidatus Parcubacteria bacterium]|nr:MAG: UvrABC system protein A [Candidatus Parcubacteria bacterium]
MCYHTRLSRKEAGGSRASIDTHMQEWIEIKGARTHNLKNISVRLPRDKLVVITGLSGSGKSSLAFDTIFAEGQRRYIESLSPYARQFISQMQKPDVDEIIGLSPAIAIDQKSRSNNPRSTVATITEIYDFLRILYARIGKAYCLEGDARIARLSLEEIRRIALDRVRTFLSDRQAADSKTKTVAGVPLDDAKLTVSAPVVVGRKGEYYQLLYDLLHKGFEEVVIDGKHFSLRERIELSRTKHHTIDAIVDEIPVAEWRVNEKAFLERLGEAVEMALNEASGLVRFTYPDGENEVLSSRFVCPTDGTPFPEIEPRLFSFNSPYGACPQCRGLGTTGFLQEEVCPVCRGKRLRPEALHVFLGGERKGEGLNIIDFTTLSIEDAQRYLLELPLTPKEREISHIVMKEILTRLQFMIDVGIGYLTLDRTAGTLSGGEAQRIRLASQLGSGLVGALYVLDEPTIGLHQRDNERLIQTLLALRDLGNTVIVVEHDEDTIRAADYLIDIGPGAGKHGGEVVVADFLDALLKSKRNPAPQSRTVGYVRGELAIAVPERRRTRSSGELLVKGATVHNLRNVDVRVPLGKFVCITGVSGSGKSTLLYDVLYRNLSAGLEKRGAFCRYAHIASLEGIEHISRVVLVDQSPIGRTPRSNPATYTGAFTFIRELFAQTPEARARGWSASRFSFNVKGGRCEACQGNGVIAVEMHFLPTVFVTCDVCDGKRYLRDTLEARYRGKNIYDVLRMTVEEGLSFFSDIPQIYDRLKTLADTGLGYLELGQSATTLSGGEAQRLKIASELYRPHTQKTIYLLDEPTVGLHYDDVARLIAILQTLVDRGHTVVVIEHNLDLIKCADWIIDMGPEGGVGGGKIVAVGTPEQVARSGKGHTARYLARALGYS